MEISDSAVEMFYITLEILHKTARFRYHPISIWRFHGILPGDFAYSKKTIDTPRSRIHLRQKLTSKT
jgi:hypothetical protein